MRNLNALEKDISSSAGKPDGEVVPGQHGKREKGSCEYIPSLKQLTLEPTFIRLNIDKGLIGAAFLGALVLLAPMSKQSREFVNCVKNAVKN